MSLGKLKAIRQCAFCGKDVEIYHNSRLSAKNSFCNNECASNYKKSISDLNTICLMCGKKFHLKPYHKNKYKTHCCSKECFNNYKKEYMLGEGNHQYGLKGNLNASWKSDERISHYGYRLIRVLDHPFRNEGDFVFEHRLVAEKYLLTEENSIEIDSKLYLKGDYVVHHKDFNRLNNDVANLEVMTRADHTALHAKLKVIERDELGRFKNVIQNNGKAISQFT